MAIYTIGDLHLSLGASKPMDIFRGWDDYVEKLRRGFECVNADDTVVLCGDLSWGMSLEQAREDFRFISELPGRKILLKGNHDYWFETVSKSQAFFTANGFENMEILNNNAFLAEGVAICGTRGWIYDDNVDGTHNGKIMAREVQRLETSLRAAEKLSCTEKLCFLHYPPRFGSYVWRELIDVMYRYEVKRCWYGHIHGSGHRHAVQGKVEGIEYSMISADYVDFVPQCIKIGANG